MDPARATLVLYRLRAEKTMESAYASLDKWPWEEAAREVRSNLDRFKKGDPLMKMGASLDEAG